jgi:AbrB family looped-hinge helix DNA binding protein
VRITSKGQVTIPIELRERLGLVPEAEVEFELDGDAVRIRKASRGGGPGRGAAVVAKLRGRGDVRMTTDEILALTRGNSKKAR